MTAQHTPGPWSAHHHESTDTYTVHVEGRSWESWGVAHVGYTKEDDANARLIAAAPELLEALIAVVNMPDYDGSISTSVVRRNAKHAARAAIAKATGGAA